MADPDTVAIPRKLAMKLAAAMDSYLGMWADEIDANGGEDDADPMDLQRFDGTAATLAELQKAIDPACG